MIRDDVWGEQVDFNKLLREFPAADDQRRAFIRDMVLNLMSEANELLGTTTWKSHRRQDRRPNREHQLEEVIDIFKIWLTIAQGLGFSADDLSQAYFRKSMVVRQRHSEEWVKHLTSPTWVLDIDNVLCDYIDGFCTWLADRAPLFAEKIHQVRKLRMYFSGSEFGMTSAEWQGFKHEFRTTGQKRYLPVMEGAVEFVTRLRDAGYHIILLTSRPIDRYPNIYTDTLYWLNSVGLSYDWLWWASDKGERLIDSNALRYITGVVDDDERFVKQFAGLGLQTYWLVNDSVRPVSMDLSVYDNVHRVRALSDIAIAPVIGG